MALDEYRRKRAFGTTNEPEGRVASPAGDDSLSFVVQKHAASHLHFDFRLELDGVLKSWAVPKGPSLDPSVKRLAVHVEDHPLDYGGFEGIIPADQYGGGAVMLWDRGSWHADGDAAKAYRKGRLKFELRGERLQGRWNLVRTRRTDGSGAKEQWLLIKEDDEYARPEAEGVITAKVDTSVASGRTMEEIAADADAEWQSDRAPSEGKATAEPRKPKSSNASANGDMPAAADQPGARKAAFPKVFPPELATLVSEVPLGEEWVHEIKYDGYRLVALVRDGKVRLLTRGGNDWTSRFSTVATALADFPARSAVIDGEVVVMDEHGVSSFQMLQNLLGPGHGGGTLVFFAFDLPYLDGYALLETPLLARKALLLARLPGTGDGVLRYSDHVAGNGPEFYRQACDWRLEGIISKRADSRYRSRRTKDWLKVKCTLRQEFVIGGFTAPRGSRSHFGALLVGVHDGDGTFVYAGKVGTGFDAATLKEMYGRLKPLETDESPFADYGRKGPRPKDVGWVEPRLVCEVEFTEWTGEGQLRHPVFRGLREDKPPSEVVRERTTAPPADADTQPVPAPAAEKRSAKSAAPRAPSPPPKRRAARSRTARGETEVAGVRLTSPDRVLYPDLGLTKMELARYYEQIADWAVQQVGGRALTLVRCPRGQGKQCFYQKHADDAFPAEIRRIPLKEGDDKNVVYTYVDSVQGIISLVQLGVLEMHTWGSRVDRPERPDRIVMDLDPGPGVPWARVVESAIHVRARLEELGFASFVKTTGGKGLHVVVPLVRRNDWDEVKAFTRALAFDVAARHPGRYVTKSTLSIRKGKIYIDYLRNARGATTIAAYSVRARPGAAVAVPLRWDELSSRLDTSRFTPDAVVRRLRSLKTDPWDGMDGVKQSITRAVRDELEIK